MNKTRWNPYGINTSVTMSIEDVKNKLKEAKYPVEGKSEEELRNVLKSLEYANSIGVSAENWVKQFNK